MMSANDLNDSGRSNADNRYSPGRLFDDALYNFNKKGLGILAPKLLKAFATASEPFVRVNMGQRYLDSGAITGGVALWFLAAIVSGSVGAVYANRLVAATISGIVLLFFVGLAGQDRKSAIQRHFDGSPRHSMSRGQPRSSDPANQFLLNFGLALALALFATPAAAVFIISRIMSALAEAKQQEAILSRYFDAIDAKIEAEQLETALLGQTPPENTFLYKSLPPVYPDGMRRDIASAAASSTLQVLTRGPKPPPAAPQPVRPTGPWNPSSPPV